MNCQVYFFCTFSWLSASFQWKCIFNYIFSKTVRLFNLSVFKCINKCIFSGSEHILYLRNKCTYLLKEIFCLSYNLIKKTSIFFYLKGIKSKFSAHLQPVFYRRVVLDPFLSSHTVNGLIVAICLLIKYVNQFNSFKKHKFN